MNKVEFTRLFPKGLAGILYDCDGVMIDSENANRHFYNTILAAFGLPPMTPEQERFAFMSTAAQALRKMVPPKDHDRIESVARKALDYDRDILPRIKLMPGFVDFIAGAETSGLRQGIVTNRTDFGIERVLDFFSLPPYFNPVISSSVAEPKPSPEGALAACRQWHVEPGRVLFVGDSADDRDAAKSAGNVFAAFGGKGLGGDLDVASFSALGAAIWPFVENVAGATD